MPVTANSRTMIVRVDELEPHDRVAHGAVLGPFQVTADAVVHSVRPGQFNKLGVKFYNIGVIYLHPATLVEVER